MARLLTTITAADVGKSFLRRPVPCPTCGRQEPPIHVGSAIGHVQRIDIGKRVYDSGGVIQVESDSQRDARIAREEGRELK